MDFAASSALIHFPFAVAPKKSPNSTATIGWSSPATALAQIPKAASNAMELAAKVERTSIFFLFFVRHSLDRCCVVGIECNRHSLSAAAQISVLGFPSLGVHEDQSAGLEPFLRRRVGFDKFMNTLDLEFLLLGRCGATAQLGQT